MKNKLFEGIQFSVELILCALFMYTGVFKTLHFEEWIERFNKIDLIREYNLEFLAYVIPFMEITVSVIILIDKTKLIALLLAALLMFTFTGYIYYKIYISDDSLCPCGGIFDTLTLDKHLYVNIATIVIIIFWFMIRRNRNQNIINASV